MLFGVESKIEFVEELEHKNDKSVVLLFSFEVRSVYNDMNVFYFYEKEIYWSFLWYIVNMRIQFFS